MFVAAPSNSSRSITLSVPHSSVRCSISSLCLVRSDTVETSSGSSGQQGVGSRYRPGALQSTDSPGGIRSIWTRSSGWLSPSRFLPTQRVELQARQHIVESGRLLMPLTWSYLPLTWSILFSVVVYIRGGACCWCDSTLEGHEDEPGKRALKHHGNTAVFDVSLLSKGRRRRGWEQRVRSWERERVNETLKRLLVLRRSRQRFSWARLGKKNPNQTSSPCISHLPAFLFCVSVKLSHSLQAHSLILHVLYSSLWDVALNLHMQGPPAGCKHALHAGAGEWY